MEYLGYEFTPTGYRPLESAWPRIENFPQPTTRKEVQKFLGTMNYYRAHIPNFAELAAPLYQLVAKDNRFIWADQQQKSKKHLKSYFRKELR